MNDKIMVNYRELAHASYHNAIHQRLEESLEIVNNAISMMNDVSETYHTFYSQLTIICSKFSKIKINQMYSSELLDLWNLMLKRFTEDAQIYQESSEEMVSQFCKPLQLLYEHKRNQGEKLYEFKSTAEELLIDQSENMEQLQRDYVDQYQTQREKYDPKMIPKLLTSHNNYLLQLVANNKMREQYHVNTLPAVLEELESIQREIIETFTTNLSKHISASIKRYQSSIDSHENNMAVIRSQSVNDQISNFVRQLNANQAVSYWKVEQFLPPDGDCPEILSRDEIITDKLTEETLQIIRSSLLKEQGELQSFISQNEDVINILKGLKANRSCEKLHELEDDICRKQNEVKMAQIQLSGIISQVQQIESKKISTYTVKDDEGTGVKKIWKKAVFSLKRDKGSKHISILKTIKRDSFRPGSSPLQTTIQRDDSKVDPVYHLLRCAASKNQTANIEQEIRATNSSPIPKFHEAAFQSANGRLSLIQSAVNMATLSRRRLMLSHIKEKSSSVDEGSSRCDQKNVSVYEAHETSSAITSPKDTRYHRSSMPHNIGYTKLSPVQHNMEHKSKPKLLSPSKTVTETVAEIVNSRLLSPRSPLPQSNSRKMLNHRMKSFSVDNPDNVSAKTESPVSMSYDKKKMSNSYTNTNLYESNVPISPRRRKILYGRKKSFSLEQDSQFARRRVAFDEDSLVKRPDRSRLNQSHSETEESVLKNVADNSGKSWKETHTQSWRVKSFSFDTPEIDLKKDFDTSQSQSQKKCSLHTPQSLNVGSTPSPSPKQEAKRLDRISESLEKSLSSEREFQNFNGKKNNQKVLTYQKEHVDDSASKQLLGKLRYRLSGNLYVALYDFWARQKDELDLRAGWKVSAIDMSDPDWWTGKCNGKLGYFPANYVQAIHQGEHVWRVIREITPTDSTEKPVRLYKNQILVQTGSQEDDHILIRTKGSTTFWCPIDCVTRVYDNYG